MDRPLDINIRKSSNILTQILDQIYIIFFCLYLSLEEISLSCSFDLEAYFKERAKKFKYLHRYLFSCFYDIPPHLHNFIIQHCHYFHATFSLYILFTYINKNKTNRYKRILSTGVDEVKTNRSIYIKKRVQIYKV
jgi:hypothetical protein